MRALQWKEWRLSMSPVPLLFLLLSGLILIPNYPYYVTFFYNGLGLFMLMQSLRENRDTAYLMLLPVTKAEMVRARFRTVVQLELLQVLACIPFMALRASYGQLNNAVGIEANTAFLGLGLCDVFVGVGLVDLQGGTDVFTYVDVGNVDGQDFKSRTGIQTLFEYQFGDGVRIFQNLLVVFGRSDGRNDTFAYTGQDSVFTGTTYQLADIGAYRYTGFGYQLDTILSHGRHGRSVNHLRVYRHLNRFEHVTSGKVDGGGHLEGQFDVRFGGGNQCMNHSFHVSAGKVVSLQ